MRFAGDRVVATSRLTRTAHRGCAHALRAALVPAVAAASGPTPDELASLAECRAAADGGGCRRGPRHTHPLVVPPPPRWAKRVRAREHNEGRHVSTAAPPAASRTAAAAGNCATPRRRSSCGAPALARCCALALCVRRGPRAAPCPARQARGAHRPWAAGSARRKCVEKRRARTNASGHRHLPVRVRLPPLDQTLRAVRRGPMVTGPDAPSQRHPAWATTAPPPPTREKTARAHAPPWRCA